MAPRKKASSPLDYKFWIGMMASPLIAVIVALTAFYFTTKNTLDQHNQLFVDTKTAMKDIAAAIKAETEAREKIRNEYLTDMRRTSDGIAELAKLTAVNGTKYDMILDRLNQDRERKK